MSLKAQSIRVSQGQNLRVQDLDRKQKDIDQDPTLSQGAETDTIRNIVGNIIVIEADQDQMKDPKKEEVLPRTVKISVKR